MATYTKIKKGEYKVTVNNIETVVLKIGKTEWHVLIDSKVVTKGKTRAKAVEAAANMKAEPIELIELMPADTEDELTLDTLDTLLDEDELPNIHPECIKLAVLNR